MTFTLNCFLIFSFLSENIEIENELARFPSQAEMKNSLDFNWKYIKHCEVMLKNADVIPGNRRFQYESYWFTRKLAAERIREVWYVLYVPVPHYSSYGPHGVSLDIWKKWLNILREQLGEDAYWRGGFPPPVPVDLMEEE